MKEILSKEEFVAHMEGLKTEYDKLDKLYSEFGIDIFEMPWCYSSNHFSELLEQVMDDEHGNISWWCWTTYFGRDEEMTQIFNEDGSVYKDIKTAEDLYDYLVELSEERDK